MAQRNTVAEGYGQEHKRDRAAWKLEVDAGLVHCWGCGTWLHPDEPWHLAHNTARTWSAPQCVPCNDGAAARLGNERRKAGGTPSLRL